MNNQDAVLILASLAQSARLEIFRLLVQSGPNGLAAGDIALKLNIPASTLSFHLKELSQADLVIANQKGRFIYYVAAFKVMNGLLSYLTENCCQYENTLTKTICCDDLTYKEVVS